jgi:hypothetical protein
MAFLLVIILAVIGFAAGFIAGVLATFHLLPALGRVEGTISKVARTAHPF